jgi:protein-tyrosine phosphatase
VTRAELHWIAGIPHRLAIMPRPRGGDWLADEARSLRTQGVDEVVSLLTDEEQEELDLVAEEEACRGERIGFRRFRVADRSVPSDADAFGRLALEITADLKGNRAVAIHCRAGVGRSAMLAAAVLTLMGQTVEESFRMIGAARGCAVPDTDEQRQWVEQTFGRAQRP